MWKVLRPALLLIILAVVAANAWIDHRRVVGWRDTLDVGLFPIAADQSPVTRAYVAALTPAAFLPIQSFLAEEAHHYDLLLERPFRLTLHPPLADPPPALAPNPGVLDSILWSLRMRLYASRAGTTPGEPRPHIRLFLLYHDPSWTPDVPHSLGLEKGMIGVAHLFADAGMTAPNDVVIAHELLHTVGATDKYDLDSDVPRYPEGYAEPDRVPRYPQRYAELMAGRRPDSATTQSQPASLDECVVGAATAAEIHWHRR